MRFNYILNCTRKQRCYFFYLFICLSMVGFHQFILMKYNVEVSEWWKKTILFTAFTFVGLFSLNVIRTLNYINWSPKIFSLTLLIYWLQRKWDLKWREKRKKINNIPWDSLFYFLKNYINLNLSYWNKCNQMAKNLCLLNQLIFKISFWKSPPLLSSRMEWFFKSDF